MDRSLEHLGEPDLRLAGLQLWVHGREFENLHDFWDGNWLQATAHCSAPGAAVRAEGTILRTVDLARCLAQVEALHASLTGTARLDSLEPALAVTLAVAGSAGRVEMGVEITPDHLSQQHRFEFSLDQSYLPPVVVQLQALLQRFPVRGTPAPE